MAPRNPFFATPIGQAAGALASAFGADPDGEATALARAAQARLYGAQTGEIENRLGMARSAGDRLRAGDYSPATLSQVIADMVSGADPRMAAAAGDVLRAFGGAAGAPPERLAQLFVGAGGNYAHTQPGFEAAQRTDLEQSRIAAGPGYARVAEDRRQFNSTHVPTLGADGNPVLTPRSQATGAAPVLSFDQARGVQVQPFVQGTGTPEEQGRRAALVAPGVATAEVRNAGRIDQIRLQGQQALELQQLRDDRAAGRLDTQGRQRLEQLELQNAGRVQNTQAQGQQRIDQITLQGQQRASEIEQRGEQQAREAAARGASAVEVANIRAAATREAARIRAEGQQAAAANRPAPAVPRAVADRITSTVSDVVELVDPDGQTRPYRVEPAARQWIQRRAAELWQSGPEGVRGNPDAAIQEAIAELRANGAPRTDTSWLPSTRHLGLPPQGAQPPARTEGAAPEAVPPPAQRERGRIYETPRGPMIWTGTGWRPAS
jgi:hypothetical protein